MIRLFSYFADWCHIHNMNPAAYKIVIIPQSADAEARLKYRHVVDMESVTMSRKPASEFFEGFICGVPFEIRGWQCD